VGRTIASAVAPDDAVLFGKAGTTGAAFVAATEGKRVSAPVVLARRPRETMPISAGSAVC
jgi:hypothetical protein